MTEPVDPLVLGDQETAPHAPGDLSLTQSGRKELLPTEQTLLAISPPNEKCADLAWHTRPKRHTSENSPLIAPAKPGRGPRSQVLRRRGAAAARLAAPPTAAEPPRAP